MYRRWPNQALRRAGDTPQQCRLLNKLNRFLGVREGFELFAQLLLNILFAFLPKG